MKPIRQLLLLGLLVSLLLVVKLGCISVNSSSYNEARFKTTQSLSVASAAAIVVRTHNGSVNIRHGEAAETSIVATLSASSQKRLDQMHVVTKQQAGGILLVTIDYPAQKSGEWEGCSFDITVPAVTQSTKVDSSNGAILLESVDGPAVLETSNAVVEVRHHSGPVNVRTSNGAVIVSDVKGPATLTTSNAVMRITDETGNVHASTSNGAVVLQQVTGEIDAHTSNATMELMQVCGRTSAQTSNGSIAFSPAANSPEPFDLHTSNATMSLKLPSSYAGRLALETSNSVIHYAGMSGVHDVSGDKNHVVMNIGNDTRESTAQTSNGAIELQFGD
ncbi:MAG TPA: hypothetical protein VFE58_05045 [Tepidisphaeraceae bacterium]|jgi:hypothetical protein|nr:hypothetical protein [Tepidisphaeraceae bacterium]